MMPHVLFFEQIDHASLPYVGGKGANLGELTKAGFPVPGGFCVTTSAYGEFIATSSEMNALLAKLASVDPGDLNGLRAWGERIRSHLLSLPIPTAIRDEIVQAWRQLGPERAYAVRSSATAEDLPTASFAGQQDTYLNIKGQDEILQHVRKCWASLFTDRAIAYRAKNGFDHREVFLSVVVQQMVFPEVSGIMFTADPINSNRTVVSIDASFGLGEAVVSGLVSADLYQVKNHTIIEKKVSQKKLAIYAVPEGGTVCEDLPPAQQHQQALSDEKIIDLAALGRKIEAHYGSPQDIEFCMSNQDIFIVQSRPITTLYPLPDLPQQPVRVLISFGHAQMMLDAMRPLGISVLRSIFPVMLFREAGGRVYVDLSDILHSRIARMVAPKILANADEAMSRAIEVVVKRPEFLASPKQANPLAAGRKGAPPLIRQVLRNLRTSDPKQALPAIEAFAQLRLKEIKAALTGLQGAERIAAVQTQLHQALPDLGHGMLAYIASGIIANRLLNKRLKDWLGDADELHYLNMSLPGNITSKMGLDLGDLADLLRELPEVQDYLRNTQEQDFLEDLVQVPGGIAFRDAFEAYLDRYGMRCPGEIDITNPRWRETPSRLIAAMFSHIQSVKPGEHRRRFAEGEQQAEEAALRILARVKESSFKTRHIRRLISVFRNMGGLREYPKYFLISMLDEYKKAIMAEAGKLVQMGVLADQEDVYYLKLEEFLQILQGSFSENVPELIDQRKAQYRLQKDLKPPRVMTSEGEIISVPPQRGNIAEDALIGSPVSAGVREGIARVILRPENAFLHEGEILVAPHTDPGWTPLFQSAIALVTEAGGLMTHGAVVAREYGIPAVVGVDDATTLIKDGALIRVDGDQGFVQILTQGKA